MEMMLAHRCGLCAHWDGKPPKDGDDTSIRFGKCKLALAEIERGPELKNSLTDAAKLAAVQRSSHGHCGLWERAA